MCGGSGTSLGSCGPTGARNMTGQTRKSSKSEIEARPLRRAASRTESGRLIGWESGSPGSFATSGGIEGSKSPMVSPTAGVPPATGAKGVDATGAPAGGSASAVLKSMVFAKPGSETDLKGEAIGGGLMFSGDWIVAAAPSPGPLLPKKLRRENAMNEVELQPI